MDDVSIQFCEVLDLDCDDLSEEEIFSDLQWFKTELKAIGNLPKNQEDEKQWLKKIEQYGYEQRELEDEYGRILFDYEINEDEKYIEFFTQTSGDPHKVAKIVQEFFRQRHPDRCFTISYSRIPSRIWQSWLSRYWRECARSEFGGAALFVTADSIEEFDVFKFLERQRNIFELS